MDLPARDAVYAAILAALDRLLADAEAAATSAREVATAKENVAENKYDTLGLEAAYLAHGQSERAAAIIEQRVVFERLATAQALDQVGIGSLVLLTGEDNSQRILLLAPAQGGLTVSVDGVSVQVVTPAAPIGKALQSRAVGDEIQTPGGINEIQAIA